MRQLEELALQQSKSIREILQELFTEHRTQSAVAKKLGVSQSTLSYWLLKLNLEQRVVLVERKMTS